MGWRANTPSVLVAPNEAAYSGDQISITMFLTDDIVSQRTWLNYIREPMNTVVRVAENGAAIELQVQLLAAQLSRCSVFLSMFVGLLYLNAGDTQGM